MKLRSIRIKGFKCFEDSLEIPIHKLTVFIGENDSGKSSVLDALELLLEKRQVTESDYHEIDGVRLGEIEITGSFDVQYPVPDGLEKFLVGGQLTLRRIDKSTGESEYFVNRESFVDDRFNTYESLLVPDLRELCKALDLSSDGVKAVLIERMGEYIAQTPLETELGFRGCNYRDISEYLPIWQRYTSSDYGNPNLQVGNVLKTVYRKHFYSADEDGNEVLKDYFLELKSEIEQNLDSKINENLREIIQRINSKVIDVKGRYNIDFSNGLSFQQLLLDTGSGLKPIGDRGEGSKKRLYLAILEWDKKIEEEIISTKGIIKAYDEPDANLHFDAQRKLFNQISAQGDPDNTIQSIICTHSLTMIDRAPAISINRLVLNEDERSQVHFLETDEDDDDVRQFLSDISEMGGITNSSIFYEKCFVLVEGASEVNALPIMYKKVNNKNLIEDGVVLVNLESNGAWRNFLKLLSKNKRDSTILFLDSDTQWPGSSAQITAEKLEDIGFEEGFIDSNVIFAGDKEFEDTFDDNILIDMLNNNYRKASGDPWVLEDIVPLREGAKFSEALRNKVGQETRRGVGKPIIARNYARTIEPEGIQAMEPVRVLFEKIAEIIS